MHRADPACGLVLSTRCAGLGEGLWAGDALDQEPAHARRGEVNIARVRDGVVLQVWIVKSVFAHVGLAQLARRLARRAFLTARLRGIVCTVVGKSSMEKDGL